MFDFSKQLREGAAESGGKGGCAVIEKAAPAAEHRGYGIGGDAAGFAAAPGMNIFIIHSFFDKRVFFFSA